MQQLLEIAEDYKKVKNYVYGRYGGIGSLFKIYPGYTVQNEMTKSGLRAELDMPSVYFYLAMFDALGDIKSQWTRTKFKVLKLARVNQNLTAEEKHYLRFLLKVNNAFDAVLNERPVTLQKEIQRKYDEFQAQVDTEKLHRYLCRQVRKYHVKQHADSAAGLSIAERAYRYGDSGIYISTKEKRKRIFIPLTDHCQYQSQLYVKLYQEAQAPAWPPIFQNSISKSMESRLFPIAQRASRPIGRLTQSRSLRIPPGRNRSNHGFLLTSPGKNSEDFPPREAIGSFPF